MQATRKIQLPPKELFPNTKTTRENVNISINPNSTIHKYRCNQFYLILCTKVYCVNARQKRNKRLSPKTQPSKIKIIKKDS